MGKLNRSVVPDVEQVEQQVDAEDDGGGNGEHGFLRGDESTCRC